MTETELQADSLIRAPETMVECPRNVLKIVGMDEVKEALPSQRLWLITQDALDRWAVVEEQALLV